MAINPIFEAESRDGEVARPLNLALHTLSVHSGMEAISEGERIKLNFTRETEALIRALSLLGVERDATLPHRPGLSGENEKKPPGCASVVDKKKVDQPQTEVASLVRTVF